MVLPDVLVRDSSDDITTVRFTNPTSPAFVLWREAPMESRFQCYKQYKGAEDYPAVPGYLFSCHLKGRLPKNGWFGIL